MLLINNIFSINRKFFFYIKVISLYIYNKLDYNQKQKQNISLKTIFLN